jgi:cyclopropane fatty-acyl-phospholipid synthase-like methyltransferase
VDALPLAPGMRVLEVGCGPGAMARELAARVGADGAVLAIDRSPRAIAAANAGPPLPNLVFRECAAEALVLRPGEAPYDLAVAVRVGALDGRHPERERAALAAIAGALVRGGRLYVDGEEVPLR